MKGSGQKISKFIYWTPRVLGIVFVLFLTLFSLDVFELGLPFTQLVLALVMHNIPSIVLLMVLLISWRYEIVGGIVFILAGLLYIFLATSITQQSPYLVLIYSLIIGGPSLLIGILFLKNWRAKIADK